MCSESVSFYAGIGSRKTPADVLTLMKEVADYLGKAGFGLRTGGAKGADSWFESGAYGHTKQIFLPNPEQYSHEAWEKAKAVAAAHHPAWHKCTDFARKLHTRNVFQILGPEVDHRSLFVLCWTPDGVEDGTQTTQATGGTGQAIRIASTYGVPVYNLANPSTLTRVQTWLNQQREAA